ncbi:MAG: sn-glycerol-3-phosphate ABC transporter ATP-binding protein UgpC [Leptospiraceae bacterium]|nr:sn-glycerol-3-phosphate ABC transporter ATP-binding protein UgpC [Leptospiraceae bacterium]MDW8305553.1 sn-glycerol-3-phosphate ABC transporter ATP-binding protein UgpC [Leptospiraceae bacterium]
MAEIVFRGINKSYRLQKSEFKKKVKAEIRKLKEDLKDTFDEVEREKIQARIDLKREELREVPAHELTVDIIRDFNLHIQDREFVVFVGPSGCGKSTVLRMLAGLEDITSGEIEIGGRVVNQVAPKDRDIAFVFQSYALYPHLSIFDNIAFGLKLRRMPSTEIQQRVYHAAEILQLTEHLHKKPRQLSGGQRQRVAMGRAIVRNPAAFLFDEPLSNLDAKLRQEMRVQIKKITRRLNTTTVYVTHDQIEAMTLADKIVVLNRLEGPHSVNIQQIGAPLDVYYNPANTFVAGFIGTPTINLLEGEIEERGGVPYFVSGGIELRVGESRVPFLSKYRKKKIRAGIRPHDFEDAFFSPNASSDNTVEGVVDVAENLGAEIHVQLQCGDLPLTAVVSSRSRISMGEKIRLVVNLENIHYFDYDTGQNINRL